MTVLARPSSIGKQAFVQYAQRGVIVKSVELGERSADVVQALSGIDVVVSCMTLLALKEEMALVEAAHEAGVRRYVPSFFGPACPPRGVMIMRDMVSDILT